MPEQFQALDLTTPVAPAEVLQARLAAHQTQDQAAATVGLGAAIRWSEYERGERNIDPMRFLMYLLLTDQHPTHRLARRRRAAT
jgi:hypothetical protein